ncbi:MAG: rRNA pseudouridine synthase [Dokdonella sp.]
MNEPSSPAESIRLAKRVIALTQCSRREAEQLIEGGWVSVDGVVVEEPQHMVASEVVTIDPGASPATLEPATLLLHKPAGVEFLAGPNAAMSLLTPATRSALDNSGIRLLKRNLARLTPLMPLERDASGLMVLSQDPGIARKLMQDGLHLEQEFIVEIEGEIAPYGLFKLSQGLNYNGRTLAPCKVSWQNEVRLRFAIKGVQPGQLRDMCAQVGLEVIAMKRIRIGRVALGKVAPGEWRHLPSGERF